MVYQKIENNKVWHTDGEVVIMLAFHSLDRRMISKRQGFDSPSVYLFIIQRFFSFLDHPRVYITVWKKVDSTLPISQNIDTT